jgi:D-alanyl-lipoteichoic acid acyltransferase DltB (MBOAT superfamily)
MNFLNLSWQVPNLDLLLPVGISFFIFQAVGYSIDVYRGHIKTEKNFGVYALFVSYFPQLVAGPIERSFHLLPQFRQKHYFDSERLVSGLKQMIWGFFMKVVVADRLSLYVEPVYNNLSMHNGTTIFVATFLFAFQIYCDFAGYSNIAIGTARIMGFDLMTNFNRPYFAKSISEFWKRWHISLSTWFRDYVYIPLGGNKKGSNRTKLNILTTFIISGIWHGANWTFVVWGGLHGVLSTIEKSLRIKTNIFLKIGAKIYTSLLIFFTFTFVCITWIFFRSPSNSEAFSAIYKIFFSHGILFVDGPTFFYGLIGVLILIVKEASEEFFPEKYNFLNHPNSIISGFANALLIILILIAGVFDGSQFIYFQF